MIVSPLVRLTNASNPPLEEVGTPEGLLNSLGSYITCVCRTVALHRCCNRQYGHVSFLGKAP